ncbi:MAG: hypothetical protein RLZ98_960 [Pseudomonadota bacterium]|jgi:penicillin-binding protein 1A
MSEELEEKAPRPSGWILNRRRPARGLRAVVDRLPWRQRLLVLGAWYGSASLAGVVLLSLLYFSLNLPHPSQASKAAATPVIRIVDAQGRLVAERGKRHPYVPLHMLPKHLLNAVVAIEDRRFWTHWGIDPAGLLRATLVNLRADGYRQGGSTLTQQLAKNLYLSSERTMARKIEESLIALWLEFKLTKAEILELYLNRVYFGAGAYGVESAAQRYFGKSARELSLPEAAVLAGLLKAPSELAPISNPGTARTRGRLVLSKMRDAGYLDEREARAAIETSVRYADFRPPRDSGMEYAVDYVLEKLPQLSGTGTNELVVETTLDAELQKAAQHILSAHLARTGTDALQGALVIMDRDGGIVAMVGGRSYRESQFNRAVKALRQPGSAFKPLVFAAALEGGLNPDSIVVDAPLDISGWTPRNFDDRYLGPTTLRDALAHSRNTSAVRVFEAAGVARVHATARRLGIGTPLHADASLALGTAEVRLLDLVGSYTHFANGGRTVHPHVIRQARLSSGRIVYARRTPGRGKALTEHVARAMNDMLYAAVVRGTGRRAALPGRQAVGKTGTTQGGRDAWFIGYTAHLVAGVWTGTDAAKPVPGNAGGGLPAAIWQEVMNLAHAGKPAASIAGLVAPLPDASSVPPPPPIRKPLPSARQPEVAAAAPLSTGVSTALPPASRMNLGVGLSKAR